jgi:hypothetical protein
MAPSVQGQVTAAEVIRRNCDVVLELDELRSDYFRLTLEEGRAMAGIRTSLYGWFRQNAVIVQQLQTSDDDWRAFVSPSVWAGAVKQPVTEDRKRPERWVLLRTMAPTTRRERQLVSKYAAALEELAARKTPLSHFVKAIEDAGGVEALARQVAKRRRGGGQTDRETTSIRVRCATSKREELELLPDRSIVQVEIRVRHGRGGTMVLELVGSPIDRRG